MSASRSLISDLRAVLGQQLGGRAADAARRAGDDRHLAVEDSPCAGLQFGFVRPGIRARLRGERRSSSDDAAGVERRPCDRPRRPRRRSSRVKSTTATPSSWATSLQQREQLGGLARASRSPAGSSASSTDGPADERAGERGALALGGGELPGALVARGRRGRRARAARRRRPARAARRAIRSGRATFSRTVMVGSTEAAGRRRPMLVAPQARELEVVEPAQRAPVEHDGAAGGAVEAGQQVQQRGLAGARGSDDGGDASGGRLERYVAEHVRAACGGLRRGGRDCAQ